jgi:DNA invertase Pin-like site-specific DNA recombinase
LWRKKGVPLFRQKKGTLTMIAVYLRVSSHSQKTDAQKPDVDRWLKGQGIKKKDVQWFEDKETGKTLDRPAFEQLKTSIFNGEVKTVVVWKLDRLSRRQRDGINILADWCEKGVRVVSVTQQLDLSGSVGRIVAGVLFGVAEMELEHVRERQAAGIAAAKKRGVYDNLEGRPKGSTKANPKRAKELAAQGLNKSEIARALGVHRHTVSSYLNDAS